MPNPGALALITGAALSAAAALAHLACIAIGPPAYRFMGAGERIAQAAAAGKLEPTLVTLAVAALLALWSAYALSGAGVIRPLPLLKPALVLICAIYLLRAIAFPLLMPVFPDNSLTFWWLSSSICAVIGLVHLYGTVSMWRLM